MTVSVVAPVVHELLGPGVHLVLVRGLFFDEPQEAVAHRFAELEVVFADAFDDSSVGWGCAFAAVAVGACGDCVIWCGDASEGRPA